MLTLKIGGKVPCTKTTMRDHPWLLVSVASLRAAVVAAFVVGLAACGGGGGGATSPTETPPGITAQPANVTVAAGGRASFSVTATGTGLAYRWERSTNGGLSYQGVAGATTATLAIDPVDASMDGHRFVAIVQNIAGIATSDAATLTVAGPATAPSFTLQPADQTVTAPATATFTVAVSGTPLPTVAWESSTDAGTTWSAITAATGTTYTTPATVPSDNGRRFRAVASNSAGSVPSQAATLSIAGGSRQRFVYASLFGTNTIAGYALDAATGALSTTPGSPYASGTSPTLTLHPSGNWLLATVVGSNAGTWVYRIDPASGSLTTVAGSPFTNGFAPGSAPVMDPAGRYVAMVQSLGVAIFRFDAATGQLTSTGTLTTSIGASFVSFSPDSRFIFVRDGNGAFRTLNTDPLALGPAPVSSITPSGEAFVRGERLVALLTNGRVVTMTIATTDGALSIFGFVPTGATGSSIQLAATADPSCLLFRSHETATSEAMLPIRISPSTNTLVAGSPVTVSGPATTRFLLTHPASPFGYLTALPGAYSGLVTPLEIGSSTCAVSASNAASFAATPNNEAVLFDSTGTFAIGSVAPTPGIRVSRIDATTRVPAGVPGSPFAAPAMPTSIILRE